MPFYSPGTQPLTPTVPKWWKLGSGDYMGQYDWLKNVGTEGFRPNRATWQDISGTFANKSIADEFYAYLGANMPENWANAWTANQARTTPRSLEDFWGQRAKGSSADAWGAMTGWLGGLESQEGSMYDVLGITGEGGLLGSTNAQAYNTWLAKNAAKYPGMSFMDTLGKGFLSNVDPEAALRAAQDFKTYADAEAARIDALATTDEVTTAFNAAGLGYNLGDVTSLQQLNKDLASFNASETGSFLGLNVTANAQGINAPGEMTDAQWSQYLGQFGQYKQKLDIAKTTGVPAGNLVQNADGQWTPDPAKYTFDPTANTYTIKPGVVATNTDTVTDTDVASWLGDIFGDDAIGKDVLDALAAGIKTPAEIEAAFTDWWSPFKTEWEQAGIPEGVAAGTEAGGGLGSGLGDTMTRRLATYTSQQAQSKQSYQDTAEQRNLAYIDEALKVAKTPADVAEIYSRSGVNMASIEKIQADARATDTNTWAQTALTQANVAILSEQFTGVQYDNALKALQLAAAEGGFDANRIAQNMQWYMDTNYGDVNNPWVALAMSLLNMQTTYAYGTQNTNTMGRIGAGLSGMSTPAWLGSMYGQTNPNGPNIYGSGQVSQ